MKRETPCTHDILFVRTEVHKQSLFSCCFHETLAKSLFSFTRACRMAAAAASIAFCCAVTSGALLNQGGWRPLGIKKELVDLPRIAFERCLLRIYVEERLSWLKFFKLLLSPSKELLSKSFPVHPLSCRSREWQRQKCRANAVGRLHVCWATVTCSAAP